MEFFKGFVSGNSFFFMIILPLLKFRVRYLLPLQPNEILPGNSPLLADLVCWDPFGPQSPIDRFRVHPEVIGELIDREILFHSCSPLEGRIVRDRYVQFLNIKADRQHTGWTD